MLNLEIKSNSVYKILINKDSQKKIYYAQSYLIIFMTQIHDF